MEYQESSREVLARIDENLTLLRKELLGNGQPGRMQKAEARLDEVESKLDKSKGYFLGAGGVLTLIAGAVEWFIHFFKSR